jgi:hypothetical protein
MAILVNASAQIAHEQAATPLSCVKPAAALVAAYSAA